MKQEKLNPNEVFIFRDNDRNGLGDYLQCNLTGDSKLYLRDYVNFSPDKNDVQHFFGKKYLNQQKAKIDRSMNVHKSDNRIKYEQIYLKWKKQLQKPTLIELIKLFFVGLFSEKKKRIMKNRIRNRNAIKFVVKMGA